MDNIKCCGNCRHWHETEKQPYKLRIGKCDKISKGTYFECDGDSYHFNPEVFEDEIYTDEFGCFEMKGGD